MDHNTSTDGTKPLADTAAPHFTKRMTENVIGALIAAGVLTSEGDTWAFMQRVETVIAEAVNRGIDSIDIDELARAVEARESARRANHALEIRKSELRRILQTARNEAESARMTAEEAEAALKSLEADQ